MSAALPPIQPTLPPLVGRVARLRAWRGSPADLMAIVQRMRDLMRPQYEKVLSIESDRVEAFFDQQIAEAKRTQPPLSLGPAIDNLLAAKVQAKQNLARDVVARGEYTQSYFVTLENNVAERRSAEQLFTADSFPQRVRGVTLQINSRIPSAQVNVILTNANPYVPQLDVGVTGEDVSWVEGSLSALYEQVRQGEPWWLRHWRWWIQPNFVPVLTWALFSWFFAVLIEYYQVPLLARFPWLAIFVAALPAGGITILLGRAILPFGVSRGAESVVVDTVRGLILTLLGTALVWSLGKLGLWLASQSLKTPP